MSALGRAHGPADRRTLHVDVVGALLARVGESLSSQRFAGTKAQALGPRKDAGQPSRKGGRQQKAPVEAIRPGLPYLVGSGADEGT